MIFEPEATASRASIEKYDMDWLIRIVRPFKPQTILEVGAWKGYSAQTWWDAFKPSLLISMDKDHRFEDSVSYDVNGYHLWYDVNSHEQETLDRVKALLGEKQVDFLFIDGDHTLEGVTQDFQMYGALVKTGGIIAFHDCLYTAPTEQVKPLWDELKTRYPFIELCGNPNSTGTGLIINTEIKHIGSKG